MLEELLSNCSARGLKSDPKEKHVEFIYLKLFSKAFFKILYEERQSNQEESKELTEKPGGTFWGGGTSWMNLKKKEKHFL